MRAGNNCDIINGVQYPLPQPQQVTVAERFKSSRIPKSFTNEPSNLDTVKGTEGETVKTWMFFLENKVLGMSSGQVYELHIVLTLRQRAGFYEGDFVKSSGQRQ